MIKEIVSPVLSRAHYVGGATYAITVLRVAGMVVLTFPLVFRRGGGMHPPACVVTRRCAHALSTVGVLGVWLYVCGWVIGLSVLTV